MTGTLETSRLVSKTRCLMVDASRGRKKAGGRRRKTATAHARLRSTPPPTCARVRSQRWHSAVAPDGSAGIVWRLPQSAQVIVIDTGFDRVQRECKCLNQLVQRDRQIAHAPAGRVVDGVGDGR